MSIAKHIPYHIKRVSRCLGYVLWLDDAESWFGLSVILRARLTDEQRAALAFQVLRSLDYDLACMTVDAVLGASPDEREAA